MKSIFMRSANFRNKTYLSKRKQPQKVMRRASISSSFKLASRDPESVPEFKCSPRSQAIRKLIPLYTQPLASRPQPASLTDMSASACTVVNLGLSCSSFSIIRRFASYQRVSDCQEVVNGEATNVKKVVTSGRRIIWVRPCSWPSREMTS